MTSNMSEGTRRSGYVRDRLLKSFMARRGPHIESYPLFGYDLGDYDKLFPEKLDLVLHVHAQAEQPAANQEVSVRAFTAVAHMGQINRYYRRS